MNVTVLDAIATVPATICERCGNLHDPAQARPCSCRPGAVVNKQRCEVAAERHRAAVARAKSRKWWP